MITRSTRTSYGTNMYHVIKSDKYPPTVYPHKNKPSINFVQTRHFGLRNPKNGETTFLRGFLKGEILKKISFDCSDLTITKGNTKPRFSVGIVDCTTPIPDFFLLRDLTLEELSTARLEKPHTFENTCTLVFCISVGGMMHGSIKMHYEYWGKNVKPANPFKRGKKDGRGKGY